MSSYVCQQEVLHEGIILVPICHDTSNPPHAVYLGVLKFAHFGGIKNLMTMFEWLAVQKQNNAQWIILPFTFSGQRLHQIRDGDYSEDILMIKPE